MEGYKPQDFSFFHRSEKLVQQYKMIQVLRSNNHLPVLHVKIIRDPNHIIAEKLYKKTNQFNMSQQNSLFSKDVISVYFEMYRPTGESLGICSAISYIIDDDMIRVSNYLYMQDRKMIITSQHLNHLVLFSSALCIQG